MFVAVELVMFMSQLDGRSCFGFLYQGSIWQCVWSMMGLFDTVRDFLPSDISTKKNGGSFIGVKETAVLI
jgi:hypothetical protein